MARRIPSRFNPAATPTDARAPLAQRLSRGFHEAQPGLGWESAYHSKGIKPMDKKLIAVAVTGALALPMSAQALEGSVSGHIGRTITFVDAENEAEEGPKWSHQGLGASGTRFRFTGSEDLENGVTVGVNLEYGAGGSQGDSPGLRHSALTFSGAFGSIAAGQTGPATNGTNDDLSASGLAVGMACDNAARGNKSCPDFTASRRGVVKYTTPAIGALGVSGSLARDFADAQVSASGELGGGSYALRASFANFGEDADGDEKAYKDGDIFSAAAAFKIGGVSASTLWGSMRPDQDGKDVDGFGVKLGYDLGDTGIGLVFRQTDKEEDGTEPTTWGIGVQHNMMGVDLLAGYYSYDPDMPNTDETNTFTVGSRIKF